MLVSHPALLPLCSCFSLLFFSSSPSCCFTPRQQPIRYQDSNQNLNPSRPLHRPPPHMCVHAVDQLITLTFFFLCSERPAGCAACQHISLFTLSALGLDSELLLVSERLKTLWHEKAMRPRTHLSHRRNPTLPVNSSALFPLLYKPQHVRNMLHKRKYLWKCHF